MKYRPSERKIKGYILNGLPGGRTIDPPGYRRAFYRADKQLRKSNEQKRIGDKHG